MTMTAKADAPHRTSGDPHDFKPRWTLAEIEKVTDQEALMQELRTLQDSSLTKKTASTVQQIYTVENPVGETLYVPRVNNSRMAVSDLRQENFLKTYEEAIKDQWRDLEKKRRKGSR